MLLFLLLGFGSRRNFPLVFITSFVFLLQTLLFIWNLEKIKPFILRKELKHLVITCLILVSVAQYADLRIINNPFNYYCRNYPCQALEFLKNDTKYRHLNLLNDYNWGGFLIWAYPERKLFIDGRIPQAEYKGHTFLEEYLDFFKPNEDYEKKLEEYDVKVVVIKTDDYKIKVKKWERLIFWVDEKSLVWPNYLRRHLESSDNWQKVYSDSLASIYVKVK